ncbi:MAG: O-antigen ligase family protein [Candidatus Eisenbacteria bacterium]
MSSAPRPLPAPSPAELRARAQRGAQGLATAAIPIVSGMVAIGLVLVFVVLDYVMGANVHRLVKLLIGLSAMVGLVANSTIGLFILPIANPMLGLLPKLPLPGLNTLNVVLLGIFVPFAIQRTFRRQQVLRGGTLTLPLLLLLVLLALSVLRGAAFPTGYVYEAGDAGLSVFRCFMTFTVYFITYAIVTGEQARRRMTWAIVLGALVESLYAIMTGRSDHGRAGGSMRQANELGAYLAMFASFAFAMSFGVNKWWQRVLAWGTFGLASVGVLFSVSRGGMVALALATLWVTWRSARWVTLAIVLVLATSPAWLPDYAMERIHMTTSGPGDSEDESGGLDPGAESRVNTWHTILHIVQDHAIEGIGFESLHYVLPQAGEELGLHVKDSSHNTFFRLLAEAGIFGLGAFLFLFYRVFRLAETGVRLARDRFDRQLSVGLSGAALALFVSCWFGDRFFQIMITGNLWVACALVDDLVHERRSVPA